MPNPMFLHYTYYHCTKRKDPRCTQRSIEARTLERQIDAYLSRIQISPRFRDWAITNLRAYHEQEVKKRNEIVHSQQKAYQDCLTRLDHLVGSKPLLRTPMGVCSPMRSTGTSALSYSKKKHASKNSFRILDVASNSGSAWSKKRFILPARRARGLPQAMWQSKKRFCSRSVRT